MTEQGKPLTEAFIRALYTQGPDVLVFNLAERGMIEPEPVDPLVYEARRLVIQDGTTRTVTQIESIRNGHTGKGKVDLALAALRRGKELGQAAARPLTRDDVREAKERIEIEILHADTSAPLWRGQLRDKIFAALTALTQQMEGRDG